MATRSKIWQGLALFLFLVVLPVGSWYYLRSGYQYRKAALEELQDLGKVQAFSAVTSSGDTLSEKDLEGHTLIAAFLPEEAGERKALIGQLDKLYRQFDARNDILFVSHYEAGTPLDTSMAETYPLMQDTVQWVAFALSPDMYLSMAKDSYGVFEGDRVNSSLLTLVDTASVIKRHYDSKDNQQMGRLIEHITIVMPRTPEKDVLIRREKEK
jgi:hypothetical protein